jgi:hypothetical protein
MSLTPQQQAVYNALSTREYTPAALFVERIDQAIVPRDDIYKTLVELSAHGLAELAYGKGWRAIDGFESASVNEHEKRLNDQWKAEVMTGETVLGYAEWVVNEAIKHGYGQDNPTE